MNTNNILNTTRIISFIFEELKRKLKRSSEKRNNLDHINKGIEWLSLAQDMTQDGGVSIRYSLKGKSSWHPDGWQVSYPETTGYIIPTFFSYAKLFNNKKYENRAVKMAEWLLSVQKKDGSVKGGDINSKMESIVFDVGQVIFGFLSAYENTNEEKYINAAIKAGDWLVSIQNSNGTWTNNSFNSIPHSYHSRVAWSLLKLYQSTQGDKYLTSAVSNIEWVISNQKSNGWFDQAGFSKEDHNTPLTHTIAYTIRGVLECGIILNNKKYISSALKSADCICEITKFNGYISGRYNSKWKASCRFSCLTGNAQLSIILLRLYGMKKCEKYLDTAKRINNYLKKQQKIDTKITDIKGAIPGSYPFWRGYESFSYPNWATKFFIDALMLEELTVNI